MTLDSLASLSDEDLIAAVKGLARSERLATARLIAALAELDARRLYLGEGCSSLFTYCTQVLRLSEHAAYGRIEAARAARRFPLILDLLTDGSITLTTVGLLSPHLTPENHRDALAAARGKSKRDVEHLVAHLAPRPDVPTLIRKLPAAKSPDTPREQPSFHAMPVDQMSSTPSPKRGFLEFHHVKPFAAGGTSLTDNIELRCRSHNAHEANLYFGFDVARERARPTYSVRTEWPLRATRSQIVVC